MKKLWPFHLIRTMKMYGFSYKPGISCSPSSVCNNASSLFFDLYFYGFIVGKVNFTLIAEHMALCKCLRGQISHAHLVKKEVPNHQ